MGIQHNQDVSRLTEKAVLEAGIGQLERLVWHAKWKVEKFNSHGDLKNVPRELWPAPDEVVEGEGNMLMYGGASCLWECLEGNGTGTGGEGVLLFVLGPCLFAPGPRGR